MVQTLKFILKNIMPILLCAVLCTAGAYVISEYVLPKTYVSTVKLYVYTPQSNLDPTVDISTLDYAQKVTNTYIEILQTKSFYQKVMNRAKVSDTVDHLQRMVEFSSVNQTAILQAKVSAHDPGKAKAIADAIMELAPATIGSLKKNSALEVVDPATRPVLPSFPNTALISVLGFLLGAAGSFSVLFLRSALNVKIESNSLVEKCDIPVLASIPAFGKKVKGRKAGE